ncbi:MAG: hypothetical protein ACLRQR_07260 [Merdimonas faecis]|uniref:hypothetical protein n=1 Tax=Merdimonas faecis TaxID=1653435 RepID=UPI00399079A4
MKKVNPQIKILGEYQTATTPIKCECITCRFEWSPTPDSLLHHHGCPDCAGNRRKTHDEFVMEMEKSHPKIKIIGKYTKRKSKIRCCCRECGAEFEKWVDVLYNLKKCPVCMCRL